MGQGHIYWNIVENKRTAGGYIFLRQVLYLGGVNNAQQETWRKTINFFEYALYKQVAIFLENKPLPGKGCNAIQIRINELEIKKPCQWEADWLFCELWGLFWKDKLLLSRKGRQLLNVFKTLTTYRRIDLGSEWRLIGYGIFKTLWKCIEQH